MSRSRRVVPVIAVLILAACGGSDDVARIESGTDDAVEEVQQVDDDSVEYSESAAVLVETEQVPSAERDESLPSGLATFGDPLDELPPPTIDLGILRSGGPPPDGIPAIDDPTFHDASTVDYLGANDPVVAIEVNGDARAYPLEILIWHELVNDTVGGVPVSIAYCPLCNSVTVYEREIDGQVLDFGVSGLLYNSSLVMYDRQTETLWSHFVGEPLYGALGEARLVSLPSTTVGWATWVAENPDGLVLTRDTGNSREYGRNPYPGYDDVNSEPFLFEGAVDGRYTAMTRVVGVESSDGGAAAFPLLELREARVVTDEVGSETAVAFWVPGSGSALDGSEVSGGVDVGTTGVFSPVVDGEALTFRSSDDGSPSVVDDETGSTWNVFGTAVDGELTGTQLDQFVHIDTFWFAWIAFHPDSAIAAV